MADAIRPRFSPGEDSSRLMTETTALLDSHWSLDDSHQGLLKTFNFPTYAKALDFILLIGVETKVFNHHPVLTNVCKATIDDLTKLARETDFSRKTYKTVSYHWTTHTPRGLSSKDLHMARLCDDKAKLLGCLAGGQSEQKATSSVS